VRLLLSLHRIYRHLQTQKQTESITEAIPYTGNSIVIQFAGNLWNDSKLNIVDQYASNGYDLKAVVPFNDKFFFILESEVQ
jgi:hypothetical protein